MTELPAETPALTTVRLGHVGLCVPDLDAAAAWYCDVFGFELLEAPRALAGTDERSARVLRDVFGASFRSARIAQLGIAGDVGLELFEFVDPPTSRPVEPSYFHAGVSHVCFQTAELEATIERVRAKGGKVRTEVWRERPGLPHRFVHFEDPFGNLLELHSHGNRETVTGVAPPA